MENPPDHQTASHRPASTLLAKADRDYSAFRAPSGEDQQIRRHVCSMFTALAQLVGGWSRGFPDVHLWSHVKLVPNARFKRGAALRLSGPRFSTIAKNRYLRPSESRKLPCRQRSMRCSLREAVHSSIRLALYPTARYGDQHRTAVPRNGSKETAPARRSMNTTSAGCLVGLGKFGDDCQHSFRR